MNKCKCGSAMFIERTMVSGWWVTILSLNEDGTYEAESRTDELTTPKNDKKKTVCALCGKKAKLKLGDPQ